MRRGILALALVAALAAGCGGAPRGTGGAIHVTDVWSRSSAAGARAGVLYLTLTSEGGDRLVGVTVPPDVAASAELHGVYHNAAGQLSMRRLEYVDLPRRAAIAFYPGALHIMLIDLTQPLAAGRAFDATLHFRDAADQVIHVVVRDG